jgi:hypothetical protein
MAKSSQQRVSPDLLNAIGGNLESIAKAMRENRTIAAYELVRQLQEFVAYERAKHSAQ